MSGMSRRDFLKKLGLSTAGSALITPKLFADGYSSIDDALIKVSDDPSQITSREVRDHRVGWSYVGAPISITMNDSKGGTDGWKLLDYSPNIEHLDVGKDGALCGTMEIVPKEDAGKEYWMTYMGLDEGSTSSGVVRTVRDEIDRYKTKFTIDYIDKSSGSPVQNQVTFVSPNSVTKFLMGWNPDDDMTFYDDELQLSPASTSDLFVQYFANLQSLLHEDMYVEGLSRVVNRNTPVPVDDPNPFYGTLHLLDAISQGDVTKKDELYPVGVTLKMYNFAP